MSTEPGLVSGELLLTLRREYRLDLAGLNFMSAGTAPAYRADGPAGRYFVKVVPDTTYGAALLERICAEAPLLRALRTHGILNRVPRLLTTRTGADDARHGTHAIFLYEWIEARSLSSGWTAALPEIAPLLGQLHRGAPLLLTSLPRLPMPREDFALPFRRRLLHHLDVAAGTSQREAPGLEPLRDLLAPHLADLRRLFSKAEMFSQAARTRPHAFVVCHTDAHGGNVMRDASGALWLIDWETARLAPPEHDLWMLHARLPEVQPAYEEAVGRSVPLSLEVLGFYLCRRVLEDLAVDMNMILHENVRPEQDAEILSVIRDYVLPDLTRINERLDRLATAFA